VAARLLHQAGWAVQVLLVGHGVDAEPLNHRAHEPVQMQPTDAALALAQAQAAGLPLFAYGGLDSPSASAATPGADVLVDALLGLGASRPPAGDLLAALQRINAFHHAGGCVVAVDLPSGLHAGTGQALGALAATASHTLALLTLKPGLFTGAGRELAGEIWFDDLGVSLRSALHEEPAARPAAWLAGPAPSAGRDPGRTVGRGFAAGPAGRVVAPSPAGRRKTHDSHKGAQGQVLVLGGAPGMEGAAQLAARAALAAGAGRVHLCLLDEAGALMAGDATTWDPTRPELLHPSATTLNQGALLREAIVLCGCGAGPGVGPLLNELLQRATGLVLDADALNVIASRTGLASLLRTRRQRGLRSIITPHPLEAARLLGSTTAVVQANRLGAAAALARDLQCTVVLKGSGTVVAEPGEPLSINPSGNSALATAGTGDVLAGWLAGLWAQQPAGQVVAIARQAVWQHGYAADEHAAAGHSGPLLAADLVQALAAG
jgi:ADP-dependent NAD(P)H-hydrate dehydratase / NAD(P)H-hydrate epimerase